MAKLSDYISLIEVRTSMTPPFRIDLTKPGKQGSSTVTDLLQPVVILTGAIGHFEVRPSGVTGEFSPAAKGLATKAVAAVGAGVLGVGLLIGSLISRRK